mgnify:CR=1 FL=1
MKFDPLGAPAGELAVGDRLGSGLERVHAGGENPPLTGHRPCLKLLVKIHNIGGGGHPYEYRSALEIQIKGRGGDLSCSSLLP